MTHRAHFKLIIALMISGSWPSVYAQSAVPSEFSVTSVKPSGPGQSVVIQTNADNFLLKGFSLRFVILYAYNIQDYQLDGAPSWIDSARYDIAGKIDVSSDPAANDTKTSPTKMPEVLLQERLQALLADRFQLKVHQSTKEGSVYGLVVSKGGPKLTPAGSESGFSTGYGKLIAKALTMPELATLLCGAVMRPVYDKTGLTGKYQFELNWSPTDKDQPDATLPSIYTAIQEQLGLKLEAQHGPIEAYVVDHIEKPSAN